MQVTAEKGKSHFFYGYVIVAAGFVVMAVASAASSSFAVFLNPLLDEFGWTRAMASGASSLYIWLMTLFGIGAGRLTDRFGPRPVLTGAGILLGAGFFLMSRISSISHLYFIYGGVMALAMGAQWIPILSVAPRWFAKRRALMQGLVLSGGGFGMMVWPPVATHFIYSYGWRDAFIIMGAIIGVLVVLAAQFMRRAPAQAIAMPQKQNAPVVRTGFSLRQAFMTKRFWLLCAVYGALWFCGNLIHVHIVIHAIDQGLTPAQAAIVPAIMGGVGIGGRILMGALADRIGYQKALMAGFGGVLLVLVWLVFIDQLWTFYLFAVFFSFAHSVSVLESPLTAQLFSLDSLGEVVGGVECVSTAFGTISPLLGGRIYDVTGSYQLAFIISAGVAVAGLVLTLFLGSAGRRPKPALAGQTF